MAISTGSDDKGDIRPLVIIALFLEAACLLGMIAWNPALLNSAAFMLVVGFVIGNGGQGGVTSWLFGGTQVGGAVMKSNAETLASGGPSPSPGTTTTTVTGPTATVTEPAPQ